ncbi:MAG: hypothetical protein ACPGEF_07620, partial [Endozoicomonas sp.]
MSMPIGGTGSTSSTDSITPSSVVDNTDSRVSSGYGTDDTVSYAEGGEFSSESSEVSLDTPSAIKETPEQKFQQAIAKRLTATTSLLSFYSDHLTTGSGGFDIQSDTASILLVLRGFVNDLKIINNAQEIATVANNRQLLQTISRLKIEIKEGQAEIYSKEEELTYTNNELATNTSALNALSSSLSTAEAGKTANPTTLNSLTSFFSEQQEIINAIQHIRISVVNGVAPAPDQVALVNNQIARLQGVISSLDAEVS